MQVDWLALVGFRSYSTIEWEPDPGVNVLVGPNGAGKTNLLEAIGYLGALKSFRGASDSSLINNDSPSAVVRAGVTHTERDRLIEVEIPRQGQRRTQVDKTRLRRSSDLLGVVRIVAFLPEDLDIVKRGPAYRRDLIDDLAIQLWPATHLDAQEYERALRQRNAFLKSGANDEATLGVWDARLAQSGGRLLARRRAALDLIAEDLAASYGRVSNTEHVASISYSPSWSPQFERASAAEYASELTKALEGARRQDYERRMTTVGPHRDEPSFRLDQRDTREQGSQGEQRTTALAVKLAAHAAISESIEENPVLLLDDVFSELDPERSLALAKSLPEDTQTIISTARPEDVPLTGRGWKVSKGSVDGA